MRLTFLLPLFLLMAWPAFAQKVSILPVKGKGGKPVQEQISEAVCEEFQCVPIAKLMERGKPSWSKAQQQKVKLFISLAVAGKGAKQKVQVALFDRKGPAKVKKVFPLKNGELPAKQLALLQKLIRKIVPGAPAEEEADEPLAEAPPPKTVERSTPSKSSTLSEDFLAPSKEESTSSDDTTSHLTRQEERAPPPPSSKGHAFLLVEGGIDVLSRNLSYRNLAVKNVRTYDAKFVMMPRVGLEFRPLAKETHPGKGLALAASYATTVGFSSRSLDDKGNEVSFPTSMTKLEILGKFRWAVQPVTLIPQVGFQNATFGIGKSASGLELDGFPGISYSALVLGLGFELPIATNLRAVGQFSFLPVLSSGEIISSTYFTKGSTAGLDGSVGLLYFLTHELFVSAQGTFNRYTLTFQSEDADIYRAEGASDVMWGGTVRVGYQF